MIEENKAASAHLQTNIRCIVWFDGLVLRYGWLSRSNLHRGVIANKTAMPRPSDAAKNAAKVVPAPVGQVVKVMPVAAKVTSFLELAPKLANTPANIAKIQKVLKGGRPGRDDSRTHKGYCKNVGNVLVRVCWKKQRWVFGLHRAEKCKRGQTHVLVEEKKAAKDFLEGLLWLQERVSVLRRFGFCKKCDKELPDIGMYCAECVVTSLLEGTANTD